MDALSRLWHVVCLLRSTRKQKLAGRHFQCDAQIDPRKAGSTMNEGLVWLVWIPVSVILLVLLINTFIIV